MHLQLKAQGLVHAHLESALEQVSSAQSNITTDRRQRQPSITSAALFSLTSSTKEKRVNTYFSIGLACTESNDLLVLCARQGG